MTSEQKFMAMQSLLVYAGDAAISRRECPPRWYVTLRGVDIKDGPLLIGGLSGGDSPEEAIHAAWDDLTRLTRQQYIVVDGRGEPRRAHRWNGFMWAVVDESAVSQCT